MYKVEGLGRVSLVGRRNSKLGHYAKEIQKFEATAKRDTLPKQSCLKQCSRLNVSLCCGVEIVEGMLFFATHSA